MAHLGKKVRFRVLERCNFTCHYCGRKAPEVVLEVDHIEAKSLSGSDKDSNLVAACRDCNGGKGNHVMDDAAWIQTIREARSGDYQLYMEFYCQNSNCACREVTVRAKDYDETLLPLIRAKGKARCPACSKHMKLHFVETSKQHSKRQEWLARMSVNTQRFIRDKRAAGTELVAIPANVMCDDSLPG